MRDTCRGRMMWLPNDKYSPTLETLEKTGQKLEIGCFNCGNVVRIRPSWTGFRLKLTVHEAADQLSCPHCGKSNNARYHYLYGRATRRPDE